MAIQIRLRRGTAAEWTSSNPVLAQGELGVETDTSGLKVGDGSTNWSSLPYAGAPGDSIDISSIAKGGIVVGTGSGTATILTVGADGTILGVDTSDSTIVGWVAGSIAALSDTSISSPSTGDLLKYDGSNWVNASAVDILQDNQSYLASLVWGASSGYFARGLDTRTVYRWTFPSDTVSTMSNNLGYLYENGGAFVNAQVAGYFSHTDATSISKRLLSTDAVFATTSTPSSVTRNAGFENPAVAGYFSRGNTTTTVYKWTFPADTVTTTTSAPNTMLDHAGFANPAVAGYFSRGNGSNTVYKYAFPADTVTTTTNAPDPMRSHAGFANPSVAGYFSQGAFGSMIFKWTFPADTASYLTFFSPALTYHAGFANPAVAGYFSRGGGYAFVHKLAFPTDAVSTTTSAPATMGYHAGFGNGY